MNSQHDRLAALHRGEDARRVVAQLPYWDIQVPPRRIFWTSQAGDQMSVEAA